MLSQKLKIRRIGNSQGIILPGQFTEALKLHVGSDIEVWIYDYAIILTASTPTLEDLVASVPKGESFKEANTGRSVGGEE